MTFKGSLFKTLLLSLTFSAVLACKNEDRELEQRTAELDSLSSKLALQQQINDSLKNLMEKSEMTSGFPVYFGRSFDTINEPKKYITDALKQQKELIPMEAVLGGNMDFRQVQVLTEDWVLAIYDDGHVQGKTIYEYELLKNGKIRFSEVVSKLPNDR